ncbi:hypothetical protein XELAEV_18036438mg [Xenopus laevis]|uniref:Secreted protein n=1 Tax=Xenopus laevis TaxID=8355 RepID=A0A974CIT3_XENLA|nr:hypothetical protein XELAEV_18036438mg [Xenopus laevis]
MMGSLWGMMGSLWGMMGSLWGMMGSLWVPLDLSPAIWGEVAISYHYPWVLLNIPTASIHLYDTLELSYCLPRLRLISLGISRTMQSVH